VTRLFFLHIPPPPSSTLFPYTTLFRSVVAGPDVLHRWFRRPREGPARPRTLDDLLEWQRRVLAKDAAGHLDGDALARRSAEDGRSEEHTSELQSRSDLVCRLLLEKKKK